MAHQYTPQQIDKVLQELPRELREAVFSVETADAIWQTCTKQGIIDKRMSEVAEYTGYVLMGLMLPQEFEQTLEKEVKIPKKKAVEIGREINRFVFYPVKPALEQLHQVEVKVEAKAAAPKPEEKREEQPPKEPSGPDSYREEIE